MSAVITVKDETHLIVLQARHGINASLVTLLKADFFCTFALKCQ